MKKIILALVALCLVIPAVAKTQLEKAQEKQVKTMVKKWKNENRTVLGSQSPEVVLLKHYEKLNSEDAREIVGISGQTKSKNAAMQMAKNSAITSYAREAASSLKGRVVADMQANGMEPDYGFDHFYAAYESLVEKEINGEIQQSFSTIKNYPDGTCEVESFCIVSENAATAARVRAVNNALKESEAAQKYADKVAQFVREGF